MEQFIILAQFNRFSNVDVIRCFETWYFFPLYLPCMALVSNKLQSNHLQLPTSSNSVQEQNVKESEVFIMQILARY
jgi:hypothetical protein